jgi:hypothetical protein
MDEIETELEAAAREVEYTLRGAGGLDAAQADRLRMALRAAAQRWKASSTISKSAALLLVDLAMGLESCGFAYPGEEGQRIREFAYEVSDLVRECVA